MVILCGDAVYCQDNFDHDSWEGQSDPDRARETATCSATSPPSTRR